MNGEAENLRVLIANQLQQRLEQIAAIVRGLGHQIVALELDVANVGELTRNTRPDIAFVGLGEDSQHALDLISRIVQEATCPVITILDSRSPDFVREAARQGVFAYVTDREPDALQGAIEIVLRRFTEYHGLQGAFGRRAVIERAKGILMARHQIGEQPAFELMRQTSQRESRKLVDVAQGVVDNYLLLPAAPFDPVA
jgi:response regulator NasT